MSDLGIFVELYSVESLSVFNHTHAARWPVPREFEELESDSAWWTYPGSGSGGLGVRSLGEQGEDEG
jgi:hypothetical protein